MTLKKIFATMGMLIIAPFKGINYITNKAINSVTPQLLMMFTWSAAVIYGILKVYGDIDGFTDILIITIICMIAISFAVGITVLVYTYTIEFLCFITSLPAGLYDKCKKVLTRDKNIKTYNNHLNRNNNVKNNNYSIEYFIEKDKNKPVSQARFVG